MRIRISRMMGIAAVALGCGCGQPAGEPEETIAPMEEPEAQAVEPTGEARRAVATLEAKSGSSLTGEAFFVPQSGEVSFEVHVENVEPGLHAVHIHESGDCSAADASSAGEHWNPTNEQHGRRDEGPHHLGDIGNMEVGEDGGSLSLSTDAWSLEDMGERSVLGKALVVHAGEDDFTTQPDGGAGDRIGCGVIEWKQEQDPPRERPEGTT